MVEVTLEKYKEILDEYGGQEFFDWYRKWNARIEEVCGRDNYIITISDFIACWKAAKSADKL